MTAPGPAADLPGPARRAVAELAAAVLGGLPDASVPVSLRRVRGFVAGRRAVAGAAPLGAAVERDAAFRAAVAAAWRERHPGLASELDDGVGSPESPREPDDLPALLAGLYLTRPQGWADRLRVVAEDLAAVEPPRPAGPAEEEASARLADENEALRAEAAAQRARADAALEELAGVRRELRRHRSDADRARAQARAALADADRMRLEHEAEHRSAEQALRAAQDRAAAAEETAAQARRAEREGRTLGEVRARLLLDTILGAAAGLQRELALPPAHVRPADLTRSGGAETGPAAADLPVRAWASDDPEPLTALLQMPQAHLVVDGYNVSKTAWPTLPLVEQRRRLVDGLASLVARTGAEVTCCFDGADVGRRAVSLERGVRVRFSEPGETADDLVRRLVRAEPRGRVVVVVSSDAEVANGVRAHGARAVASAALVRMLGR